MIPLWANLNAVFKIIAHICKECNISFFLYDIIVCTIQHQFVTENRMDCNDALPMAI